MGHRLTPRSLAMPRRPSRRKPLRVHHLEDRVVPALAVGLTTTNQLVFFDTENPGSPLRIAPVTGLQLGEDLLGIDVRPATGQLYGLGSTSRLYTIDQTTGVATQVGAAGAFLLSGADFGFDFNPVPDRIRVVSDADQNLRLNPNDGSVTALDVA